MIDFICGDHVWVQAAQLSSSSHGALGTPYVMLGLGDAYYFIELLAMGARATRSLGKSKPNHSMCK